MSVQESETEAVTRLIAKLKRIKWTVENVSQLLEWALIKGPKIYYEGTCMCEITLQKENNHILIKLCNKSTKKIQMIKSEVVLLDCDGKKLREKKNEFHFLPRNQNVSLMKESFENQIEVLNTLKDDKLIIYCCLKVVADIVIISLTVPYDRDYQKENGEKILKDLKSLYNNPDGSDFTFQVGDDIIYAHKTILSFRSEYFKRMFQAQMKEEKNNYVLITDVALSTMKNLVEFLYTGYLNTTNEDHNVQEILNLYVAADKYQLLDLKSLCADKIISTATIDNIIDILKLAARHNDEDLKSKVMTFISFKFPEIVKTNTWKVFLSSEVDLASEVLKSYMKKHY